MNKQKKNIFETRHEPHEMVIQMDLKLKQSAF